MSISQRKNDHIRVNLEQNTRSDISAGFERYRLIHNALPEADFGKFDISSVFLGKRINAPVLISSMTGGTDSGERINTNLLAAANALNIPFAIGSMRIYIEKKAPVIPVRKIAPDIPVLANVGAVQLNYGFGPDQLLQAVESIGADALILHFNPLQELLQRNGDTDFSGLLPKIERICRDFPVPVIAKEVGWGFSAENVRSLLDAGVSMIDVAGAGGTSWAKVEAAVDGSEESRMLAEPFGGWGIPTADCIVRIRKEFPDIPLIASGGIMDGVDAAKAILLGADLAGFAGALLPEAVDDDPAKVSDKLARFIRQYKIARFVSSGIEKED